MDNGLEEWTVAVRRGRHACLLCEHVAEQVGSIEDLWLTAVRLLPPVDRDAR